MSQFVNVRFDGADKQLLVSVCKNRREDVSDFVRRAVMGELAKLSYLPAAEKKALGVVTK